MKRNDDKIFRSKVEKIKPAKEIYYRFTFGFGPYRRFFPPDAISHPTKQNTRLVSFLVDRYTKVGDTVLDPMAGTGTTMVVAALKGRNGIAVELEAKFAALIEAAKSKIESTRTLTDKGRIEIVNGDVRQLFMVLKGTTLGSHPTSESVAPALHSDRLEGRVIGREGGNYQSLDLYLENACPEPPPKGDAEIDPIPDPIVDAVITSPPYSDVTLNKPFENEDKLNNFVKNWKWAKEHGRKEESIKRDIKNWGGYPDNPENIANLPYGNINEVITNQSERSGDGSEGGQKETYLSSMLKAYKQIYRVLRTEGIAAIIVKPFIREGKPVDLPFQTWLLCEAAGFKLHEVLKLKLTHRSFWRLKYEKDYPDVERLRHEYVVVVIK